MVELGSEQNGKFQGLVSLDGEPLMEYSGGMKRVMFKQDWLKQVAVDSANQCILEELFFFEMMKELKNVTGGVHILQRFVGCSKDEKGRVESFDWIGYDGEDMLEFDSFNTQWVNLSPIHQSLKIHMDRNTDYNRENRDYPKYICPKLMDSYLKFRGHHSVSPQVFVSAKQTGFFQTLYLSCLVTGFYPGDIVVSLSRNGENETEEVQSSGIRPNGDATFQLRKSVEIRASEREEYRCTVIHRGSNYNVTLTWGGSESQDPRVAISVAATAVCLVLLATGAVCILLWKRKMGREMLSKKVSVPSVDSGDSGVSSHISSEGSTSSSVTDRGACDHAEEFDPMLQPKSQKLNSDVETKQIMLEYNL
ncbi:major histocompatibility complex class I-related gene protein-like [Lepisosteus oculatus]|uniref:major histocompatibility complex class I-related gene protein-like n=1 Tax=Lepisosteus oculatus TaxID=7918 RepID=UPI0035F52C18